MVTALYRRYRPETFAEMIGQSQVTEPLMTALRTDRVNHAYLFSGPRGCGKTTSARILARCLNCAEGPTDVPCGVCPSCVELSRGGGGSLDVVEIDAASHNGVDDARDLRERAVFAPARDRFKIFILDEAHMVTPQGFNALLKLVEEPPEHVKFIFATTEPDKVLGTIRSRTHHYPFRLVPPAPMLEYVQKLCDEEGITVQPGVLALVVRAGGGSPRDTLSLLDQLIAGSEGTTVDYERAVALLGYTHGALLDEVVDAIGAKDAAGAFAAADRVVQTGQDPRRFVEDLLERLRDLIVVAASSPESAKSVLRGIPEDELARMGAQATLFGQAELSRVADLVSQTLTEMTGATSPRLHLELMLARVLVPAADDSERGALARVERLERRVGVDGAVPVAEAAPASAGGRVAAPEAPARGRGASAGERIETTPPAAPSTPAAPTTPAGRAASPEPTRPEPTPAATPEPPAPRPKPVGPVTTQLLRDAWPEVLGVLERSKRTAWMAALNAHVIEYRTDDAVLVIGFPSARDVEELKSGAGKQSNAELLRGAIHDILGVQVKFVPRVVGAQATSAGGAAGGSAGDGASGPASSGAGQPGRGAADAGPSGAGAASTASSAPGSSNPGPSNPAASNPGPSNPAASSPASPARATSDPGSARASGPATRSGASARTAGAATSAGPAGPVDSWAVVAIPADEPADATAAPTSSAAVPSASGPVGGQSAAASVPASERSREASAPTATLERPAVESEYGAVPDDAEAPPEDEEPPFDPGPEPEAYDAAPPAAAAPARGERPATAAKGRPSNARTASAPKGGGTGFQRYGESVVREVLNATFLEEVDAPAPAPRGLGERG
ncbi:DNA polymerase III subunit gamma and tau [Agromyces sp. MMS24-K17]|uniref:DNA polymerase III subunit gamma and tau n=1 Tax=Agromyces sp. MMS24-K17 TaxID=3372850 RepID=UPI003754A4B0